MNLVGSINQRNFLCIDVDGENIKNASIGIKMLFIIVSILLNEKFTNIFIDGPETGLSHESQKLLAKFIYNEEMRKEFFPHLKQIYITTHSHHFFDYKVLSNNRIRILSQFNL